MIAILDAAQASLVERGYGNASVRQTAWAVGSSVGTLRPTSLARTRSTRRSLTGSLSNLTESYEPAHGVVDPEGRPEAFCRAYVSLARTYPEQYKVMYMELSVAPGDISPEAYRRAQKSVDDTATALAEAHERGAFSVPNPGAGAVFVWAALRRTLSLILARQVDSPSVTNPRLPLRWRQRKWARQDLDFWRAMA